MLQNYRQLEQCRQAGEDKRKTEFCVHYMIKKSIKEILTGISVEEDWLLLLVDLAYLKKIKIKQEL